jgi:hypothetical protein
MNVSGTGIKIATVTAIEAGIEI